MIRWLEEVTRDDSDTIGQKAAQLGELMDQGHSVPRGFVIEPAFFQQLLQDNDLERRIERVIDQTDPDDRDDIRQTSNRIQSWIDSIELSDTHQDELEEAYEQINLDHNVRNAGEKAVELVGGQRETAFVAVRGHTTDNRQDLCDTYLGINGKDDVLSTIIDAWQSYYAPASLHDHIREKDRSFAVMVQTMVEPEVSGTVFTRDPFNGDDELLIESVYGIGSSLSDGKVVPDRFRVDRSSGRLVSRDIATKEWKIERDPSTGSTVKHRVPDSQQDERSLTPDQLSDIATTALDLNTRNTPVQIDFSIGRNKTYILDITRIEQDRDDSPATDIQKDNSLLKGTRAASGTGTGAVSLIYETGDIDRADDSDVIASINASPELAILTDEVDAIVTENGGISSTISSIARREGIPILVACENATDVLTAGETVTVDCASETVLEGKKEETESMESIPDYDTRTDDGRTSITATGIMTINETVSESDGTVAMRYSDVKDPDWVLEAGSPDRRIHQGMKESFQGGGFLVEDYATVLRLDEAREKDATHIFLDIPSLQQQGSSSSVRRAVEEAVRATEDSDCSLILDEPDDTIIRTAVETGVDNLIIPPEQFSAFQQRLERAERSFILERLRER